MDALQARLAQLGPLAFPVLVVQSAEAAQPLIVPTVADLPHLEVPLEEAQVGFGKDAGARVPVPVDGTQSQIQTKWTNHWD